MPVPVVPIRMRRIMDHLRERGAVDAEHAVPESGVPYSERWYFERLADNLVIRRRHGLCWLDEDMASSYRAARLRRVLVVVVGCVLLAVLGLISRRLGNR